MELEKLQQIIAEVLNVDASEVMPGTTFTEDLGADLWICIRLFWE